MKARTTVEVTGRGQQTARPLDSSVVVVTTAVVLSIFSILLASNWLFTRATTM
jgi:hypothetical protein